jgi:hypothetical protein
MKQECKRHAIATARYSHRNVFWLPNLKGHHQIMKFIARKRENITPV